MLRSLLLLLLIPFISLTRAQDTCRITPAGYKLRAFYLGMDVEHLWIKGYAVDWETGAARGPEKENPNKHTHCSAFAAAACQRLNIYILRPPQHKLLLLANAQFSWLQSKEATDDGWLPITNNDVYRSWVLAQQYANKGYVTVAVFKNDLSNKPGHIAMVMPRELTFEEIQASGPNLIQAGADNYNSVSLKQGFKHHITAWPDTNISFWYNVNRKM